MKYLFALLCLLPLAGCPSGEPAAPVPASVSRPASGERGPPLLTGGVVDDQRRPIEGVEVLALIPRGAGHLGRTKGVSVLTGADGRFSLDLEGTYPLTLDPPVILLARKRGYVPFVDRIPTYRRGIGRDVSFELLRAGSIAGRVLGPEGKPLAGAFVFAIPEESAGLDKRDSVPSCETGADGEFQLTELPPRPLNVGVSAPGCIPLVAGPFEVVAEASTPAGDLSVRKGGTISGRVETPSGEPVERAVVKVWRDIRFKDYVLFGRSSVDRAGGLARTDEEGCFAVTGLAPGAYTVETEAPGYRIVTAWLPGIEPGAEVQLVLQPEAWLDLDVFDAATREPLRNFALSVTVLSGPVKVNIYEEISCGGRYRFPVNEGATLLLEVSAEGYDLFARQITIRKSGVLSLPVPLAPR